MENEDIPYKKKTIAEVLAEVGAVSNVHGISRIVTAKSTKLKVFWVALVVIGFIGAVIHLSMLVKTFMSYPVAELSIAREGVPIEFPSVTLCNINPFSIKKFNEITNSNEGKEVMQWLSNITKFVSILNFSDHNEMNNYVRKLESLQSLYEHFPHVAQQTGTNIEDFVISCRFENEDCGPSNFSAFFDSVNFYNCYTFNSGYNRANRSFNDRKPVVSDTGALNGLSLILSLNQDSSTGAYGSYEKEKPLHFGAGARVQIHAAGTLPSPASQGFDVSPGFSTEVGFEAVLHSRLNEPHGNCTTKHLNLHREYRNTLSTCLQICKHRTLINRCGCKSSRFTLLPEFDLLVEDKVPYCGEIKEFSNETYVSENERDSLLKTFVCENVILNEFKTNGIDEKACECYQPCDELTYRTSTSISYWPLEMYQYCLLDTLVINKTLPSAQLREAYRILNVTIFKFMNSRGEVQYNQSELSDQMRASAIIRQNLIRLNIFANNLRTTKLKKVPTYDVFDLLADIGGSLGLWLGISFLTLMELIELKLRLSAYLFSSKMNNSRNHPNNCDN